MGTVKDTVLRPIKLLPTFVEIDKAKYRVGQAIVDPASGEAYRSVGKNFKLVTNQMILDFLNEQEPIRNKTYYANDLGDTTYINGIFPDIYAVNQYNEVIFLGYTIANSYSLRFPPQVLFNFYIDKYKMFIKTNILLMKVQRVRELDGALNSGLLRTGKDHIQSYIDTKIDSDLQSRALRSLSSEVPKRLKTKVWSMLQEEPILYYEKDTLHHTLVLINNMCKQWGVTSYEVADAFARKIFHQLNIGAVI
jgi:hypothetical protein